MKKNNKGFIAISVIYSFFFIFLVLILVIIFRYSSERKQLKSIKNDINNGFNIKMPVINVTKSSDESELIITSIPQSNYPIKKVSYIFTNNENDVPNIVISSNQTLANPNYNNINNKKYIIVRACDTLDNCSKLTQDLSQIQ